MTSEIVSPSEHAISIVGSAFPNCALLKWVQQQPTSAPETKGDDTTGSETPLLSSSCSSLLTSVIGSEANANTHRSGIGRNEKRKSALEAKFARKKAPTFLGCTCPFVFRSCVLLRHWHPALRFLVQSECKRMQRWVGTRKIVDTA